MPFFATNCYGPLSILRGVVHSSIYDSWDPSKYPRSAVKSYFASSITDVNVAIFDLNSVAASWKAYKCIHQSKSKKPIKSVLEPFPTVNQIIILTEVDHGYKLIKFWLLYRGKTLGTRAYIWVITTLTSISTWLCVAALCFGTWTRTFVPSMLRLSGDCPGQCPYTPATGLVAPASTPSSNAPCTPLTVH